MPETNGHVWTEVIALHCMAHISACIEANLKNYMRFGKIFSRASIWDQPQLNCSICLEVTVEQRQI